MPYDPRISIRFACCCLLGVLLLSCGDGTQDWKETDASREVKRGLTAYLEGTLSAELLEVRYSDLHKLHGGLEISVSGKGVVRQQALRSKVPPASDLTADELKQLIRLLLQLKAWEQRVPDRESVASDESKARLTITVGTAKTEVWEWYQEMAASDRLLRVKQLLTRLAWKNR